MAEGAIPPSVAVAILAAGEGRRFGGSKPLAVLEGETLVTTACRTALASGLSPVVCIVGADAAAVTAALPGGVGAVHNAEWREGIASSLRAVVEALSAHPEVTAVCIGLADQPRVGPDAYRRLAAAHAAGAVLAAATYGGRRRNPVLVGRDLWGEAAALRGDVGARQLMQSHTVVDVCCDGTGDPVDVDTRADLDALVLP